MEGKTLACLALVATLTGLSGCSSTSNSSASAQGNGDTVASTGAEANTSRRDPNAKRCKTVQTTGSRLGTRVCRTNAEWDSMADASKEATRVFQQGGAQTQTLIGN